MLVVLEHRRWSSLEPVTASCWSVLGGAWLDDTQFPAVCCAGMCQHVHGTHAVAGREGLWGHGAFLLRPSMLPARWVLESRNAGRRSSLAWVTLIRVSLCLSLEVRLVAIFSHFFSQLGEILQDRCTAASIVTQHACMGRPTRTLPESYVCRGNQRSSQETSTDAPNTRPKKCT